MKKLILFLFVFFSVSFYQSIFAKTQLIRVGLTNFKNVQSIHIDNQNIYVGYGKDAEFFEKAKLNSPYGFNIKSMGNFFIKLNIELNSFEEAKDFSKNIKNGFPMLEENSSWNIYIEGFSDKNQAQKYLQDNALNGDILYIENVIGIYNQSSIIMGYIGNEYNLQFKNDEAKVYLNGKLYRNIIQINILNKKLSAINILDIEEYLYGVVPSEMPSSWHLEALKAQAVAARNYAYSNLSLHSKEGYDVCDTIHCQVYSGISAEKETTTRAVDETRGILAYYNDKLINAVYSSSNGGYSDNSENVWNTKEEYLRAIKDDYEEGAKIWERTFSFDELTNLAKNIGNVNEVILEKDTKTGRAVTLKLIGDKGEKVLKKEEIRSFFKNTSGGSLDSKLFDIKNYTNSSTSNNNNHNNKLYAINNNNLVNLDIKNTYYVTKSNDIIKNNINYIINKNDEIYLLSDIINKEDITTSTNQSFIQSIKKVDTNFVTFSGRGWGHGVGMSQFGANSLAKRGFKFDEILKYYYTGIEVK